VARPPARRPDPGKPKSRDLPAKPIEEVEADLDADEADLDTDADLDADEADLDIDEEETADETPAGEPEIGPRTSVITAFWTKLRIDPLEIALPSGVGYTLRAYRMDTDITPADVSARADDVALPARTALDEEFLDDAMLDEDELDEDELGEDSEEDLEEADEATEDDEEGEREPEEVPLFLSHAGHLLLFRTPDALIEFIGSDAEHDMTQLDTWTNLVNGIRTGYVVPLPDDAYELDLVVQNLRGGHDGWDPELLVKSGQLARDLAHALRVESVMLAMAPGSPLDDLDEALRSTISGGFGGFMARRKVKKIGEQTATLGWRTIIGKISAVVDWRD
jgi:hypothetical protein